MSSVVFGSQANLPFKHATEVVRGLEAMRERQFGHARIVVMVFDSSLCVFDSLTPEIVANLFSLVQARSMQITPRLLMHLGKLVQGEILVMEITLDQSI